MATYRSSALKQALLVTQTSGAGLSIRYNSQTDLRRSVDGLTKGRSWVAASPATLFAAVVVVVVMLGLLGTMQHPEHPTRATSTSSSAIENLHRPFPRSRRNSLRPLLTEAAGKALSNETPRSAAAASSTQAASLSHSAVASDQMRVEPDQKSVVAERQQQTSETESRRRLIKHPFQRLQHYYRLQQNDTSPRCQHTGICDGDHSCGPDGLGCVVDAKDRQQRVRNAIAWSWEGYRKFAWGQDEFDPISKSPRPWFNLGLTIVDSLDTLLLAGLQEEYQQARDWVANHLEFRDGSKVQFFEVNIRILGGLLSAYYLSDGDEVFLQKAQALADRLMVAFNTSTGTPVPFVTFQNAEGRIRSSVSDDKIYLAEAGTMSLEFTALGRLLDRRDMSEAGMKFWHVLASHGSYDGLYCNKMDTRDADCSDTKITLGSGADSAYEYMLKQWLLSGRTQEEPLSLYKSAMAGARKHLARHAFDGSDSMTFLTEATVNKGTGLIGTPNDKFEHLTCFAGAMFVLGNLHNISTTITSDDLDDVTLGARIGRACYELYHQSPTGLAPDSVHYDTKPAAVHTPADNSNEQAAGHGQDTQRAHLESTSAASAIEGGASNTTPTINKQQLGIHSNLSATDTPQQQQQQQANPAPPPSTITVWSPLSKADFLRPEAVETLFYLWRATGDEIYREWGWNMFRAFEKFCRVDTGGYSTLDDVMQVPPQRDNKMESFWIAETLKYFYLLFDDAPALLPLDQWVFNTEAHPLPVWGSATEEKVMQHTKQLREAKASAALQQQQEQQLTQAQQMQPTQEQQPLHHDHIDGSQPAQQQQYVV